MNKISTYMLGGLVGMIGEYLYRVQFSYLALACLICILTIIITDLLMHYKTRKHGTSW